MKEDTQKNVPQKGLKSKRRTLLTASLFFFATSFIGWLFETLVCLIVDRKFSDRGFLILPFCPVYGLPITLSYLFIGTPKEGIVANLINKIPARTKEGERWRFVGTCMAYFLLASAIATLFELLAGILLNFVNAPMWNYGSFPLNYKGYVCFSISFAWGVLLTISALTFLKPLFSALSRLNKRAALILTVLLWTFFLADVIFNFYYVETKQKRYELIFAFLHILKI